MSQVHSDIWHLNFLSDMSQNLNKSFYYPQMGLSTAEWLLTMQTLIRCSELILVQLDTENPYLTSFLH